MVNEASQPDPCPNPMQEFHEEKGEKGRAFITLSGLCSRVRTITIQFVKEAGCLYDSPISATFLRDLRTIAANHLQF